MPFKFIKKSLGIKPRLVLLGSMAKILTNVIDNWKIEKKDSLILYNFFLGLLLIEEADITNCCFYSS
jgi:hypothetical protein